MRAVLAHRFALLAATAAVLSVPAPAAAQQRLLIPEGTVLTVRMDGGLASQTAQVGQVFTTTVVDSVRVEGYSVIPAGSRIEGEVTLVRAATGGESGLIGVEFNRLLLPGNRAVAIDGQLTSIDPAERRQIEAQADTRVVFVGGRRGVGAAIGGIGAGSPNDPISGLLGSIGSLLSKGADVTVPANTVIAVQLVRGITMSVAGSANRRPDAFTIYTSPDAIRAAQQALRDKDYYRGAIDGRLTVDTQRALFEFQIDNGILATGNLDGRTASELGLTAAASVATALTTAEAALVRRNAQLVVGRWRQHIGMTTAMRLDPRRTYEAGELELYFALSAFADNAGVYDAMVRVSGNAEGLGAANGALLSAARRVDVALTQTRAPSRIVVAWQAIQADLAELDPRYPRP